MPTPAIDYSKFKKELKDEGCTLDESAAPHRVNVHYNGLPIGQFSVRHSGGTKKEVKIPYLKPIRQALKKAKELEQKEKEQQEKDK